MPLPEVFWIQGFAIIEQAQVRLLGKHLLMSIRPLAFAPPIGPSLT
jgi:hypothetical protein